MDEKLRTPNEAVIRAVALFGSQHKMAMKLGIRQSTVSEWCIGQAPVPEGRCAQIEWLLGADVTCEEMRPRNQWVRVVDAKWPHPKGRPLVDFTGAVKALVAAKACL